jgi:hypothetical protein
MCPRGNKSAGAKLARSARLKKAATRYCVVCETRQSIGESCSESADEQRRGANFQLIAAMRVSAGAGALDNCSRRCDDWRRTHSHAGWTASPIGGEPIHVQDGRRVQLAAKPFTCRMDGRRVQLTEAASMKQQLRSTCTLDWKPKQR